MKFEHFCKKAHGQTIWDYKQLLCVESLQYWYMHYRHQDFCCCRSCFTFFLFIKLYQQIGTLLQKYNTESSRHEGVVLTTFRSRRSKTLFTWSGGPRFSGVGFFCFVSPRAWKQKKPTPLDRGSPTPCKQALTFSLEGKYLGPKQCVIALNNRTPLQFTVHKEIRLVMFASMFLGGLGCHYFHFHYTAWFLFVALAREVLTNRHLAAGCSRRATAECGEEKRWIFWTNMVLYLLSLFLPLVNNRCRP